MGYGWILLIIAAVIFGIRINTNKNNPRSQRRKDKPTWTMVFFGSILGFIILLFIMCITISMENQFSNENNYEGNVFQLRSLKSAQTLEGDFFIGTGQIDSQFIYLTFIRTDRGWKKISLPKENTYIMEMSSGTKNVTPTLQEFYVCTEAWVKDFFIGVERTCNHKYNVLTVPSGVILEEYNAL